LKGLETVYSLVSTIKENLNPAIAVRGVLVTQVNHTRLTKEIMETLKTSFKDKVLNACIRQNVTLAEASLNRKDIFTYAPDSHGAEDYMALAKELTS
jgi:chromosome partitioning protein